MSDHSRCGTNSFRPKNPMTARLKVSLAVVGWLATVTLLHLWLNLQVWSVGAPRSTPDLKRFRVGFIPVT